MSDNNSPGFTPHSDEELARLLEQQMQAMRAAQAQPAHPVEQVQEAIELPAVVEEQSDEDDGIDSLFGALLDDSTEEEPETDAQDAQDAQEVFVVPEPVSYESLDHTQPISYIPPVVTQETEVEEIIVEEIVVEEIVESQTFAESSVAQTVVVEEILEVEPVSEDPHDVASRILNDISADGAVSATVVAASAAVNPVPQMFGEAPASTEHIQAESGGLETPPKTYSPHSHEELEVPSDLTESQQILRLKPVNSQAPKPTFDELVFGFNLED